MKTKDNLMGKRVIFISPEENDYGYRSELIEDWRTTCT